MSGRIYLINADETLEPLVEQSYINEDRLQEMIARYPDLLAGEQIDIESPRRWLLIGREFGIPGSTNGGNRWSLDHLFLDQDGIPTLVEVKRSTDSRIRREVVGQMLDYAANAILHWPLAVIRSHFENRCSAQGLDADAQIASLITGDEIDQPAIESYWVQVETNLNAGKIRLVFVADEIPAELRRIIEFLNGQMSPAVVLGVELKQYVGNKLRTIVPRVVGKTATADRDKSGSSRPSTQWDEESFFTDLHDRNPQSAAVARQILDWFQPRVTYIWWGRGAKIGGFVPTLVHRGKKHQLCAVYAYGSFELYFQHWANKEPFKSEQARRDLLAKFNTIDGIRIPADGITRRPSLDLDVLADHNRLSRVLAVFEEIIGAIRAV